METISIIIPCYNEEEAIPVYYETMVRQMDEMEEQQKVQFELIFVDDGSKDHSLFEMRRLAQKDMRCRYLSFSRNFGKEAAMYAGLQAAKGDYVTVMDVDLQDPPSLLPEMLEKLESGELDLALLTPKDAAAFAGDDAYTCYDMKTADYRGIMFNFGNEYWQKNRDLIPAVCYGLDRQAIIDAVILGQGMPAYGPLQRNVYNYEDVEHYDYNPEKAKEILEAAGCEMGDDGFYYRDGEKVGFVISVSAGDQVRIDMAQIAAQELKEIGMDVSVEIPAQTDWAGQMAFLIGWGSPFDADDHTYKVFGTDKGANYSSYSNEEVDKYLTEARQSDDPEVRKEAYANFQKALAEDPAYAMICYIDANYVADSNIKGIDPDTIMGHHGVGIFWNVADWTIE